MEIVQPITNDIYRQKVRRTDIIVEMTLKNISQRQNHVVVTLLSWASVKERLNKKMVGYYTNHQ